MNDTNGLTNPQNGRNVAQKAIKIANIWFTRALTNPTIAASVVLSGMLVFSGLGSWVAEKNKRADHVVPVLMATVALSLGAMTMTLPAVLETIGSLPYLGRIVNCLVLVAPVAFLMSFTMAIAMKGLVARGRDQIFVWAWGINGSFSLIGAAAVPLIAVSFGLSAVLEDAAVAYALAMMAFLAMMRAD